MQARDQNEDGDLLIEEELVMIPSGTYVQEIAGHLEMHVDSLAMLMG